jgi:hypothetical protein
MMIINLRFHRWTELWTDQVWDWQMFRSRGGGCAVGKKAAVSQDLPRSAAASHFTLMEVRDTIVHAHSLRYAL